MLDNRTYARELARPEHDVRKLHLGLPAKHPRDPVVAQARQVWVDDGQVLFDGLAPPDDSFTNRVRGQMLQLRSPQSRVRFPQRWMGLEGLTRAPEYTRRGTQAPRYEREARPRRVPITGARGGDFHQTIIRQLTTESSLHADYRPLLLIVTNLSGLFVEWPPHTYAGMPNSTPLSPVHLAVARPRALTSLDGSATPLSELHLSQEVITAVESYAPNPPSPGWDRVKPLVREAAARSATDAVSARRLTGILGRFIVWGVEEQGLPMNLEDLFTPRAIDQYCASLDLSPRTAATYRSAIMAAARVLNPGALQHQLRPISRKPVQPPYSASELDSFRAWANGQHTALKRRKARLMLALGAGAGLRAAEFQLMRSDVIADPDGVVIHVRHGANPREVPVLREWESWIVQALEEQPEEGPFWLVDGRTWNKSILNNFTAKTSGVAPNGLRLRATWLVAHLALGTPIKELTRAAGMSRFDNLHHYLPFIEDLGPAAYRQVLRGSAGR